MKQKWNGVHTSPPSLPDATSTWTLLPCSGHSVDITLLSFSPDFLNGLVPNTRTPTGPAPVAVPPSGTDATPVDSLNRANGPAALKPEVDARAGDNPAQTNAAKLAGGAKTPQEAKQTETAQVQRAGTSTAQPSPTPEGRNELLLLALGNGRGINNFNTNCYANCLLQILANTPPLIRYFLGTRLLTRLLPFHSCFSLGNNHFLLYFRNYYIFPSDPRGDGVRKRK